MDLNGIFSPNVCCLPAIESALRMFQRHLHQFLQDRLARNANCTLPSQEDAISFQMVKNGVNQRYGKTREFNEIQKDIFKMTYFLIRYCTEQNNIFKVFVTDQDPRTLQISRAKYLASLKYQNITWEKTLHPLPGGETLTLPRGKEKILRCIFGKMTSKVANLGTAGKYLGTQIRIRLNMLVLFVLESLVNATNWN